MKHSILKSTSFVLAAFLIAVLLPILNSTVHAAGSLQYLGGVPDVGQAKDVQIDGANNIAYLASMQFGLVAVDIQNPSTPKVLFAADAPFYAERVSFDGTRAVLTAGSSGFYVVDISSPRSGPLKVIGHGTGTFRGSAVTGHMAYLSQTVPGNPAHSDLVVVDLNDPTYSILGRVTVGSSDAVGIKVIGANAYVVAGQGLRVVDVSNPRSPVIIGSIDISGARSIGIINGYAYIASGSGGLVVVDVRTPSRPTRVGSLSGTFTDVAVANNGMAYTLGNYVFSVINATSPSSPQIVGTLSTFGAQGLSVLGSKVYLASPEVSTIPGDLSRGGLFVIDVSNPAAPAKITNLYNGFASSGVGVDGRYAAIAGNSAGLRLVDVSNPSTPVMVGKSAGTFVDSAMANGYVYALQTITGNPAHVDLVSMSTSNPSTLTVVGRRTIGNDGKKLKISGSLAYIAAGASGLQILDVSNPANISYVGSLTAAFTASQPASSVAIGANGYVYVGSLSGPNVYIIDARNASSPAVVGSYGSAAISIDSANSVMYTLNGKTLKAIDVSTPSAPVLLSSIPSTAQGLMISDKSLITATPALVADPTGGLDLIDISNPRQLTKVQHLTTPGTTRSVVIVNGIVYAADAASTVDVVRLNAPITPPSTLSGRLTSSSSSHAPVAGATVAISGTALTATTAADGSYAFPSAPPSGTYTVSVSIPRAPQSINVDDAIAVLEAAVGLRTIPSLRACDASGDGYVDVNDAVDILQAIIHPKQQIELAATWQTDSRSVTFPVSAPLDFTATLVGDCDLSW